MAVKFNPVNMTNPVSRAFQQSKHISFGEVDDFFDKDTAISPREEIKLKYLQRRMDLANIADLIDMDNDEYFNELKKINRQESIELDNFDFDNKL